MTAGQNYDHFNMSLQLGYESQYMRNTLQLNRGIDDSGRVRFSEIAFMAGVAKTDWSWAPLFADFDNDGWKDIFIGNGYRKDVTNLDFVFFGAGESPFGTPESRKQKYSKELDNLDEVKTTNQIFRNNMSLVFEEKTSEWGLDFPTYTNGAAYADFDNDGDLDLVTNNIDQNVILYENTRNGKENTAHYIRIAADPKSGTNQKIWVYAGGHVQFQELTPYRGFQSTTENIAHFGIGQLTSIDSVVMEWSDGSQKTMINVPADTVLHVATGETVAPRSVDGDGEPLILERIKAPPYRHVESSPSDIKITRTLLHELSRYGPCIASGDINGDGLDDFFIGGESGVASRIFTQQDDATFMPSVFASDSTREDGAALFFDADQDKDLDLYIASAAASGTSATNPHRLYFNDGKGNFTLTDRIPSITVFASCVESGDIDNDGDLDLFVGGRIKANEYPLSPRSYILRNDHGKFVDVTAQLSPDLYAPGMISSALWADVDNDNDADLVLAGEWMPVRVFRNDGTLFTEITHSVGLSKSDGWWNCLRAADLNHDGYLDIVAGNTGKNSYFQPTAAEPVQIVAKDFDKNGSVDPIVTYFSIPEKDRYMVHNRLVLIDQIPGIKKRFETFDQFATTPFRDAFTKDELDGAYIGSAYTLTSSLLINKKGKGFDIVPLPEIAQLSTINDILIDDFNSDGHQDLALIGNNHAQETLFGHYDASIGTILLGDGILNWKNYEPDANKFIADHDARYIRLLRTHQKPILIITNNNGPLELYRAVMTAKDR